jgi:flagellar biosynthetic protein FliR
MNGFETLAGLALLLVRPGMIVLATPFFGGVYAPPHVRVGLTVLVAMILAPIVTLPVAMAPSGLTVVIAREIAIGLAIAFAIRVLVAGAEFAGHFSGFQIGLSIGSLIDPLTGVRNNIIAILYVNVAIVVCLATNAHHLLLRALVDSYQALPVGIGAVDPAVTARVASLRGVVFVIGVRVAAPIVIVLLLVELALGLLGRVAPALNVMIAGAPVRLIVGLLIVAATVTVFPSMISHYLPTVFRLAADLAAGFR